MNRATRRLGTLRVRLSVRAVGRLAKAAKGYGVPTILTTVVEERGGLIIQGLQDVFPDQKPINRTTLNTWEDQRGVDAVKVTGRKKLVIAGLYTEICVAFPALQAAGEGFGVYVVTDASGGVTAEAHDMAVRRMVQAGINPITWMALLAEWQRDWARTDRIAPEDQAAVSAHAGGAGVAFAWEMQLLNTPVPNETTPGM